MIKKRIQINWIAETITHKFQDELSNLDVIFCGQLFFEASKGLNDGKVPLEKQDAVVKEQADIRGR